MYSIMLPQASKVKNNVFHKLCYSIMLPQASKVENNVFHASTSRFWRRSYILCFFKTTTFLMHVCKHINHLASSFHINHLARLPPISNVCKHKNNASSFHINLAAGYHQIPSKPVEGCSFANAPIKSNNRSSIKSMSWQINTLEIASTRQLCEWWQRSLLSHRLHARLYLFTCI